MTPIVDGLEDEYEGQVEVLRLNGGVPEQQRLAEQVGLRSHPSFAVLDGEGRVSQQFYGPQTAEALRAAIAVILP